MFWYGYQAVIRLSLYQCMEEIIGIQHDAFSLFCQHSVQYWERLFVLLEC